MTDRPLSPLEKAILRAVVELGDEAYGVPVRHRAGEIWRGDISYGTLYATAGRLVNEGYLRTVEDVIERPERGGCPRRYWRPAFDLTEVLKEP